ECFTLQVIDFARPLDRVRSAVAQAGVDQGRTAGRFGDTVGERLPLRGRSEPLVEKDQHWPRRTERRMRSNPTILQPVPGNDHEVDVKRGVQFGCLTHESSVVIVLTRMSSHAKKTMGASSTRSCLRRRTIDLLPQLEALNLACRRLRQLADEFDPAWVLVRCEPILHMLL